WCLGWEPTQAGYAPTCGPSAFPILGKPSRRIYLRVQRLFQRQLDLQLEGEHLRKSCQASRRARVESARQRLGIRAGNELVRGTKLTHELADEQIQHLVHAA